MATPLKVADDFTHYIAIDFGTSGSGIAVLKSNLKDIQVYTNPKWVPGQKGVAVKCPTALLLDPNGEFEAFGLAAIDNYHNKHGLRYPKKSEDYYLFNRFKMCLYEEKYLSRDLMIKAANGKEMLGQKVIAKSLEEMKNVILKSLDEEIGHPADRVLWILTVPAIWSPAAKQIMREAATEAGLGVDKGSSLMLVLEPEAAAMFCQEEILGTAQSRTDADLTSHYLVVDCGGGTVDMAAHKLTKTKDGKISIEEIHQAHGGPHGGFAVNDEFEKMLENLFQFTKENMDELKCKFHRSWTKLMYKQFEEFKCQIDSKTSTTITICLQAKMIKFIEEKTGKDMNKLIEEYTRHAVGWDEEDDGIVLQFSTINSLFAPVISQIVVAIKDVLKKPECKCIEKVLLVGGFVESTILFESVKNEFSPDIIVKKSSAPSLSVLKGAIIYGKDRNIIKSRKMCQSIGIETWDDFVTGFHDENRRNDSYGKALCTNVFTKFVDVNKSVNTEKTFERILTPASDDQETCSVKIFGSRHNKTLYTDEDSCYEIGVLTVENVPKYGSGRSREVKVALNVSGTEFTVSACCNGNTKMLPASLDFVKNTYLQKSAT